MLAFLHCGRKLLTSPAPLLLPTAKAFTITCRPMHAKMCYSSLSSLSAASSSSSTSLQAINKRSNKFNKQADLAAKMAEAKRQRELSQGGEEDASSSPAISATDSVIGNSSSASNGGNRLDELLSAEDIKLRNDRQRFADMLENSLTYGGGAGGDFDRGYYLTVEQENENADAVCKSAVICFAYGTRNIIFASSPHEIHTNPTQSINILFQFEVSPVSTREIQHPLPPLRNY
jgi:hypothetical protein